MLVFRNGPEAGQQLTTLSVFKCRSFIFIIVVYIILVRNAGSNFPLRAGKATLWEGGVRGVGFVYTANDLIEKKRRVCTELIDATDWAPTLYHLGGGNADLISARTDGKNVWETIANAVPSPRDEILHNIDPR